MTILSAQLSIWQHSFKYAKSLLRRLVQGFLPSDPKSTVYGAWLELISTLATPHAAPTDCAPRNDDTPTKLRPSADTRKQDIYAALSALTSLHALAKGNDHEDICLLADVIRLRIIFERDSDQSHPGLSGVRGIADSAQQNQEGVVQWRRHIEPPAGRDNGTRQGLNFERPPCQTIEVHRRACLGRIGE